ncbi:C39 family peptidase [Roseivirga sp. BDSF3-8]|uniref:C39 family peptidase n=1 Tax=Roseivirga sp. BDSF3-8 TaxID=3241598 RepID=UPI0035320A02
METFLRFDISAQPDDTTCGPTCLHSVYRYYGDTFSLSRLISEVEMLREGGTLAGNLGCHALLRGYRVSLYTYDLNLFDPTWFAHGLPVVDLADKLKRQLAYKRGSKFAYATNLYLQYLELGGVIKYEDLNGSLIRRYLKAGIPILTGLSATYLYNDAREHGVDHDDLRGYPAGHFVVLSGYDQDSRMVQVSDPHMSNPFTGQQYTVGMNKLIGAIMLGIVTYDANILVIEPQKTT